MNGWLIHKLIWIRNINWAFICKVIVFYEIETQPHKYDWFSLRVLLFYISTSRNDYTNLKNKLFLNLFFPITTEIFVITTQYHWLYCITFHLKPFCEIISRKKNSL